MYMYLHTTILTDTVNQIKYFMTRKAVYLCKPLWVGTLRKVNVFYMLLPCNNFRSCKYTSNFNNSALFLLLPIP